MRKVFFLAAVLTFIFGNAVACLNGESKTLKDGTFLYEDFEGSVPFGHEFNLEEFEKGIRQLDSLYKVTNDIDYLSDKGLLLIILKRYDEAIRLYLDIEKNSPNRYSTASNIGTAYELIGQNEKALFWIRKCIEIDPSSHMNSEWIHVNILEAKIKGKKYYTTAHLLDTDFGNEIFPKSDLSRLELTNLSNALYFQLNERLSFVKPKENITAQLLFDLGNIAFLLGNFHDAKADYNLAKEYGYTQNYLIEKIAESERLSKRSMLLEDTFIRIIYTIFSLPGIIGISLILAITFTIWIIKRSRG